MASVPAVAPDEPPVGAGARLALVVLVVLVVLSPWATGSVDPPFVRAITVLSLATSLLALALDARSGVTLQAPIPLWPLAGLWLLGALQLVPLPAWLLHAIAPGPASVWYPSLPEAAAVLGSGPRPISLHPEATRRSLALATGIVALALAAVPALRVRRLLLRATVAIVAGGVAVALYALVARLIFGNKLYGVWSVPTVAPFGPFVNKNHFAGYVELVALLAVGLATGLASEARRGPDALSWIESRRARWVVAVWGAGAILILAVPVSLSRGGVLSLGVGLAAFASLRLWSRHGTQHSARRLLAAAAVGVLLLTGFVLVLPAESRERMMTLAGVATEQSGSFRLGVWRDTLRLGSTSPWLGSGFGAFRDALPRCKTTAAHLAVEHAESDYLELLAEAGLVGLALAAVFAAHIVTRGQRAAAHARDRLTRALAAGAVGGLVALGVHSALDFNLRIPSNALCSAMLVAVILGASWISPRRSPRAVPAAVLPVVPLLALAISLAAGLLGQSTEPRVEPESLTRAAASAAASLRRAELESELASHLSRHPADAAAWLALAWLRVLASPMQAAALTDWAGKMDPTSEALRAAAAEVSTRAGLDGHHR